MSSNIHISRSKARAALVAVAAILAVAAGVAVAASPAYAVPVVTVNGSATPSAFLDLVTINVLGTGFPAGHFVAIAICNTDDGGLLGTHCSHISGSYFLTVTSGSGTFHALITAHALFDDWDFSANDWLATGSDTNCLHHGTGTEQCAVQVSLYGLSPPSGPPSATYSVPILFN